MHSSWNLNSDQQRAIEHEDEEQTKAIPYLQRLGDMQSAPVTVSDLNILLHLGVFTYPDRMTVKRLYEQYIAETDWAPQRHPA